MNLFDVVRDLNDSVALQLSVGLPYHRSPWFKGETDGYGVKIRFLDQLVWDSSKWEYSYEDDDYTEADVMREMELIVKAIKAKSNKVLQQMFTVVIE